MREEARFHERASLVSQEIFPPGYGNKKPALRAGFLLVNSFCGVHTKFRKESFNAEPKSYSIQNWI